MSVSPAVALASALASVCSLTCGVSSALTIISASSGLRRKLNMRLSRAAKLSVGAGLSSVSGVANTVAELGSAALGSASAIADFGAVGALLIASVGSSAGCVGVSSSAICLRQKASLASHSLHFSKSGFNRQSCTDSAHSLWAT